MRTAIRLALTALVVSPSLTALDAQAPSSQAPNSQAPTSQAPNPQTQNAQAPSAFGAGVGARSSSRTSGRLSFEATRTVHSWTEDADRYVVMGRLHDARRLLREVVAIQKAGDAYTAPTLRRLANVEFALNRPLVAARVLEDAAIAANTVSDPQTELEALVDAMVLYSQEGLRQRAAQLRPRVQRLLESPAIPEELRQKLARHLITE